MRVLYQDLRYGLRTLRESPGFTAVVVMTLALGIAANTTVFGWINRVLMHPLPGTADDKRLAVVEILTSGWNSGTLNFSYSDYRTMRDNLRLVSGIALYTDTVFSTRTGESTQRVYGELVSGNYFEVLGIKPLHGRVFLPEEYGDRPGAYPVAVISERFWRGRLNADPGIIGKTIHANRYPLTVVGVVPAEFLGTRPGLAFEMWVPLVMTPQLTGAASGVLDQGARSYWTVARLNPRIGFGQARGEVESLVRRLVEMNPSMSRDLKATVVPVWAAHTGAQSLLLAPLGILMSACVVVLLIVCSNVANLLLARSIARQREFSIRLALGAPRARLARQVLTETFLLSVAGALVGVPLAFWMGKSLTWLVPPISSPVSVSIPFNADIVGFAALVCAAATLICGLAPVMQSVRTDANAGLKESGRSGMSGSRVKRMRNLLVVSEIALAFVALVGTGLFIKSFRNAKAVHPGFNSQGIWMARLDFSGWGFSPSQQREFLIRLRQRLESAPGIGGVTYAGRAPLGFGSSPWKEIEVEGYAQASGENMKVYHNAVASGYFEMMRIARTEGRDFTELDDPAAPPVIMVNETFVRRFLGGRNPIGRKVRFAGQWTAIVGVVKDSKIHSLEEEPQPFIYRPQGLDGGSSVALLIRSAGGSADVLAVARREAAAVDPNIAMFDAMSLQEHMGGSLFSRKIAAGLLSVLGVVSLLLATLGLYGLMAYTIGQRTREIGIRMALGAQRHRVLRMILLQGMSLAAAGLVGGILLALGAARVVSSMLFQVGAGDPLIFVGAILFLSLVSLSATLLPALRAAGVDPIVALRHE